MWQTVRLENKQSGRQTGSQTDGKTDKQTVLSKVCCLSCSHPQTQRPRLWSEHTLTQTFLSCLLEGWRWEPSPGGERAPESSWLLFIHSHREANQTVAPSQARQPSGPEEHVAVNCVLRDYSWFRRDQVDESVVWKKKNQLKELLKRGKCKMASTNSHRWRERETSCESRFDYRHRQTPRGAGGTLSPQLSFLTGAPRVSRRADCFSRLSLKMSFICCFKKEKSANQTENWQFRWSSTAEVVRKRLQRCLITDLHRY